MLPPPTLHCRHCRYRVAATLLNMLPQPPKLRFRQAAASIAKLATAAVPPLLPPPPSPCWHRRTTAAYKIKKKYIILLTNLCFTMMIMAASCENSGSTRQQQMQCCCLQLPRIELMLGSDKRGVSSDSKPYWKWEQNDTTHWCTKNCNTSTTIRKIWVWKIIC